MKQTINSYDFIDAFRKMERMDQFSYSGLHALFDYLEELEDDCGKEMELDVIALCCDFSEYESALQVAEEYGEGFDNEDEALDWLHDNTTVIEHSDGIIIQSF